MYMDSVMKVAVLSDIHGNFAAFSVVVADIDRWRPDLVVVNGDVLNQGPYPERCLALIEERVARGGWLALRGNHEDFVLDASRRDVATLTPPQRDLFRTSYWTLDRLTPDQFRMIEGWEARHDLEVAGDRLVVTHASIHSNMDGAVPWMTDETLNGKIDPAAAAFVTSHTHFFFQRRVGGTLIVNSGSVGRPLDGDRRTGYARLEHRASGWIATTVRLDYDEDQFSRDLVDSGFVIACRPFSDLLLREWREARGYHTGWRRTYLEPFLAGRISGADSIAAYLASIDKANVPPRSF